MGSELSWLEHTPDKREVDGSSPFEPTKVPLGTVGDKYGQKRPSVSNYLDGSSPFEPTKYF